jgi:hypothetical protein
VFFNSANSQYFFQKFHGLVLGLIGLIGTKGIDVAQPYGNTGCGVFKGVKKLERFLPNNQHTQRKFLNFEN